MIWSSSAAASTGSALRRMRRAGLKVALFEAQDLASATSSNSSKLIHGGLRYLEHYEFRLVKEALAEREVLLGMAPHIARPMRFSPAAPPAPAPGLDDPCRPLPLRQPGQARQAQGQLRPALPAAGWSQERHHRGFDTPDAWVDDARLVVLNAMLARDKGADVQTRTRCVKAVRGSKHWTLTLGGEGASSSPSTAAVWSMRRPPGSRPSMTRACTRSPRGIRLIKEPHDSAAHPRARRGLYPAKRDNRIVFVIPISRITPSSAPRTWSITAAAGGEDQQRRDRLSVQGGHAHFTHADCAPGGRGLDLCRVRPYCDDGSPDSPQAVTRDYTLELGSGESDGRRSCPVFGGKLTTYRKLAQAACNKLKPWFSQMGEGLDRHSCRCPAAVRLLGAELARAYCCWSSTGSMIAAPCRIAEAYGSHARLWLKEGAVSTLAPGCTNRSALSHRREWAHSWRTYCGAAAGWGCACPIRTAAARRLAARTPPRPAQGRLMTPAGGLCRP